MRPILSTTIVLGLGLTLAGCPDPKDERNRMEDAGDRLENRTERAGERIEQGAERAGERIEQGVDRAGERIERGLERTDQRLEDPGPGERPEHELHKTNERDR
jgi:hypothetical protein